MDGPTTLIFLNITMFIGSIVSGALPLALTLSETKMRLITVLGAGLLIGTALAVIIPEGIHSLYSVEETSHQDHLSMNEEHHHNKRDLESALDLARANRNDIKFTNDEDFVRFFLLKASNLSKTRIKREPQQGQQSYGNHIQNDSKNPIRNVIESKLDENAGHEHEQPHSSHPHGSNHSGIGISLVLGFVFMLVIDHFGGNYGHSHGGHQHQLIDSQIRNKVTFSTTLGLVVHAAADGVALGAASASQKTDVEMIVFFAIMLHKAPAAFGLVSFLMHEGLERSRIRRHLMTFALSAPVMALLTFMFLKSNIFTLPLEATGYCMLFSAGTFLYVSTVHVLPEIQSHNDNRQFSLVELVSFIAGSIVPVFLAIGHHH